jgi:hypothetical protein
MEFGKVESINQRKSKAEFKELNRLQISDSVDLVLSEVSKEGKMVGYNINRYVNAEGFQGFTKGIQVPGDKLTEFLKLFPKENLTLAAEA